MSKLGVMCRLVAWMLLVLVVACTRDSAMTTEREAKRRPPATAVPAPLKMAVARSRQKAPGHDFVPDAGGTLHAMVGDAGAATAVVATSRGVRLSRGHRDGFDLGLETASVGRDGARRGRGVVRERAEGQELVLEREDDVEERLLAGPLGVEHSFEVRGRPEGTGPLVIDVAFDGLVPQAQGKADRVLLRDGAGRVRAGYRDLVAADAEGRELAARMEVRGASVALVIEDAGAEYPVRVNPLVWVQVAEVTAGDGGETTSYGFSVAIDGRTAIVGDYSSNVEQGSAYIFTRSGTTWTRQAELTADGGTGYNGFGSSVAVSDETAVVGAFTNSYYAFVVPGAAYVFARSGASWTQQAKLLGSDSANGDGFGAGVAVSGDTIVVGAPGHPVDAGTGAAYVFELEACEAGVCTPIADAGAEGDVTIDGGKAPDAGTDSSPARDAARDSGSARDAPPIIDAGTVADSGKQDGSHNGSTAPDAADASWRAHAGLYVSGPVGCGCRVARTEESGTSPWWLALGVIALTGRRRAPSATGSMSSDPTSARRRPNSAGGT